MVYVSYMCYVGVRMFVCDIYMYACTCMRMCVYTYMLCIAYTCVYDMYLCILNTTMFVCANAVYIAVYHQLRLAEYGWKPHRDCLAVKTYHGPRLTGGCVENRGVIYNRFYMF